MNRRIGLAIAAIVLLLAGLFVSGVISFPANSGKALEPVNVEVEGDILYDGQPVMGGIISFLPLDGDDQSGAGGGAIDKGTFRVYAGTSLRPGLYRVQIRWSKATGEKKKDAGYGQSPDVFAEFLPEKYHDKTILIVELEAGMNRVDLDLDK